MIRRVWGLLHVKSYVVAKRSSVGVMSSTHVHKLTYRKLLVSKSRERVPSQVSSTPFDSGSKLRNPSQNSPRVATKTGRKYN
ncbi:hypothetical protein AVEN_41752-2 [Araneus ventricosus]|uniref:Uncharacterized protein n=1 Tax=Araneus ventricosus TaxID=182803 RepID=A0A4Y2ABQ7_ARAVE|nr:hypothetical protein AVEN_41752-2 [Araneus ventricosus]